MLILFMAKVTQIILIDSYQKNKLDVLTCKNSKYLFYRYNDILQGSNLEVKNVKA